MVSGLVTSPCDQLRIFSGEARLMRIASKSAMGFAMSKGLERYKVLLRFPAVVRRRYAALRNQCRVSGVQFPIWPEFPSHLWPAGRESAIPQAHFSQTCFHKLVTPPALIALTEN